MDLEALKNILTSPTGIIVTVVLSLNIALSAGSKILGLIKDKTATQVDNKAYEWLGKISGWLQKGLDMLGYNPEHK